eukprot:TRINITY_DN3527_c0_g2_i3.p1 TRINITY_DN3527_c0_g2~~TRINITY_DN3527_c0_g2_i3.p1  ORF type:complete len:176 (-),score=68.55 TRINITY_DN3527_c0_g2_i3:119-646(-)
MVKKLTNEMVRVSRQHTVIITHGAPEKRLKHFEGYECHKDVTVSYKQVSLSNMAQLINYMRSDRTGKPLKEVLQDKEYMLGAVKESKEECKVVMLLRKEEELLESTEPKHKMIGMMLRTRRLKQEELKKLSAKKLSPDSKEVEDISSLRQDHCHMYVFLKHAKTEEHVASNGHND